MKDFRSGFQILFVLVLLFTLATPAQAALPQDAVVGDGTPASCTEAALATALDAGGLITFNCGGPKSILLLSVKTITKDATLDGGDNITLTAGLTTRIFSINSGVNFKLQRIILDSAFSVGASGGAITNQGNLTLDKVTIQNSQAGQGHSGGAIFTAGPLTVTNSLFLNNTASNAGAILADQVGLKITIANSEFNGNQAVYTDTTKGYGGAIWIGPQTEMSLTDSNFSTNSANYGGALMVSETGKATLLGASRTLSFVNNHTNVDGGAIYSKGEVTLRNVRMVSNKAPQNTLAIGYGGAIYNEGSLSLVDGYLGGNEGRFGGALFTGSGTYAARADVSRTIFTYNIAGGSGGGIYTNNATTLFTVTQSTFDHNTATLVGGGLARFNAGLTIQDSSFLTNTATETGGGFWIGAGPQATDGPYVNVRNVTVAYNTAGNGQGGGIYNTALLDLQNLTVVNNNSGIFFNGSISGVTRLHNTVLQNPAGLNCDSTGVTPASAGGNFSTDNSTCGFTMPTDHQGTGLDPLLGPLTKDPIGLTFYFMPLPGSPLINAAVPGYTPRDQRQATRPDTADIGAVEYGGLQPITYIPLISKAH